MPRPVADDCRRIEARQVPPSGGCIGLRWGDAASATLARKGDAVALVYRWCDEPGGPGREAAQQVGLAYLDCPFGGRRTFLCCPSCERRVVKLYHASEEGGFTCRRCGRLVPRSQSLGSWPRALKRAAKLRRYCGGSGDMSQPFPAKPKRMRWAIYECLRREAEELEAMPIEAWLGSGTHNVRLAVRRSSAGRRWWPGRNGWSGSDRRPGHGG